MLIQRKKPARSKKSVRLSHRARLCLLLVYTIALLATGAILFNDSSLEQSQQVLSDSIDSVRNRVAAIAEEIDNVELHVKFKDVERLNEQRAKAIERGVLVVDDGDYIKADLAINDDSAPVRLRLKGDLTDHLSGSKWSFRVVCRGENTLLGMKQFSLHRPEARNFIHEWVFHRILKANGIIGLRYEFADLSFNGKHWGIYAIEEHFEKRLIEHNQRREGPIVRWDESIFWSDVIASDGRVNGNYHQAAYISTSADAFQTSRYTESEVLLALHDRAIEQLDSFKSGKLKASETFDCELLGKYFALCDVLGAQHAITWNNMRFYFNPVSELLEPIGFDADAGMPVQRLAFTSNTSSETLTRRQLFHDQLASDIDFTSAYYKWLTEFAKKEWTQKWESEFQQSTASYETLMQTEYPHYQFSWNTIHRNQEFIRDQLSREVKPLASALVRGSYHYIKAANVSPVPIICNSVRLGDEVFELNDAVLPGRNPGDVLVYNEIEIPTDNSMRHLNCELLYTSADGRSGSVSLTIEKDPKSLLPRVSNYQSSVLDDLEFITVDSTDKTATILKGSWIINQPLIIPAGYSLQCEAGTTITMSEHTWIETRGSVNFTGTEDAPIVITAAKGTAAYILIKEGQQKSIWKHVHVSNLAHAPTPGTNVTGAVTFYNSPVSISECSFINLEAEDSLNLIRSNISISNTRFREAMSDALDLDFCTGKLSNVRFDESGNDAIDLSGSSIEIDTAVIKHAGDKAISCGEASVVRATNIQVSDCEIGITSKDSSDVILSETNIEKTQIGLMAFKKKPEFGPGDLIANRTNINAINHRYLLEPGSSIIINREDQSPNAKDIRLDLYDQ